MIVVGPSRSSSRCTRAPSTSNSSGSTGEPPDSTVSCSDDRCGDGDLQQRRRRGGGGDGERGGDVDAHACMVASAQVGRPVCSLTPPGRGLSRPRARPSSSKQLTGAARTRRSSSVGEVVVAGPARRRRSRGGGRHAASAAAARACSSPATISAGGVDELAEQHLGGARQRSRPAERVALRHGAAVVEQPGGLVEVLDALGDDLQPHAAAELEQPLDEGGGGRLGDDVGDEGAVDLDGVDRQPVQGGDRRVAGAEVVEGEGDALVGDDGDRVQGGLGGEQRRRLGDLQLEPLRAPGRTPPARRRRAR